MPEPDVLESVGGGQGDRLVPLHTAVIDRGIEGEIAGLEAGQRERGELDRAGALQPHPERPDRRARPVQPVEELGDRQPVERRVAVQLGTSASCGLHARGERFEARGSRPRRDPASIVRSGGRQADAEPARETAHLGIAGHDPLGAQLDHRPVRQP